MKPGNNISGKLVLPSNPFDGEVEYTLTTISVMTFYDCGLTEVVIPNTVTSIGNAAFRSCSGLTEVTIPNSVTSIGSSAFMSCSGLTEVTIPNSVTSIGTDAFDHCSALTEITIPNSVTSISYGTFTGCEELKDITIPNSVTSIGDYAFEGSGLREVVIPKSVTSIGKSAFNGCSRLIKSAYPSTINNPFSNGIAIQYPAEGAILEDGIIYDQDYSTLYFVSYKVTELEIPNSIISIGDYALRGCSSLTDFTIPNSVTSIGGYALKDCSSLTDFTITNSVTSIGDYAFEGCSNLSSFNISAGDSEISIGRDNFKDTQVQTLYVGRDWTGGLPISKNLTSLTIGDSVTSIGQAAFAYCSGLTEVTIPNSVTSLGSYAFYGCSGLTSFTLSDGDTEISIGANSFSETRVQNLYVGRNWTGDLPKSHYLTTLTIGNSVTSIGGSAFQGCSSLTEVTIPNSVTSIGQDAFQGCRGLTEVSIGNSVTSIDDQAFSGCSGLTSVTIPNSVTGIGNSVFSGCSGLTSFTLSDGDTDMSIGANSFSNTKVQTLYVGRNWTGDLPKSHYLTTLTIGNSVTSIGEYAFSGCSGLTGVTIGNSVTSIGEYAFSGCSGLTGVTIPNSVMRIGGAAFQGCSGLTKVTIPNSVTSIGGLAFSGCSGLTELTIGNSVTSISNFAFNDCGGLQKVNYSSLEHLCSIDFGTRSSNPLWCAHNLYIGENKIEELVVPSTVKDIKACAFAGGNFTTVNIPNSVMTIGADAFADCTELETVHFEDGASPLDLVADAFHYYNYNGTETYYQVINDLYLGRNIANRTALRPKNLVIGNLVTEFYNFKGNKNLVSLTLGSGLTAIPADAFNGCSSLTEVTIPNSVTSIGDNAFSGIELKELTLEATKVPEFRNCFSDSFNSATLNVPEVAFADYLFSSWNVFRNISDGNQVSPVATDNSLDYHIFKSTSSGEVKNEAFLIPGNYGSLSSVDILDRITIDGERYYVTGIGYGAFADCNNLKSVNFNARADVRAIGSSAFENCSGLTEFSIPNTVTGIGANAFSGCSGLTEITIPNTVTAIGKYAFNKCGGLKKVYYSSLEHLCSIDFGGSRSANPLWCAHNLYIGENKIEELVMPTTVKDIKAYAFAGGNFTTVNIPNSVMTIGTDAFADCTKITTVRFEDGISPLDVSEYAFRYYKDDKSYYQVIDDFYLGRSIAKRAALAPKNLVIGNLVTEFATFQGVSTLTSLTLGSGLTAIPADAFNGCSLSEVAVPVNVTEIGENAFANNNGKLSKVSMGYKLASVGDKAFDGNTIETVNVAAMTPPEAPDNVFSAYSGKLYVPAEKVDDYYDSWSCWSRFAGYPLVDLEKIEGSADKLSGQIGETVQLSVTLTPENLSLPYVFWRSTNPELAIVDNNGLVTIVGGYELGECKIIAETLYDTDKVATFDVKSLSTGIFEIVAEEGFEEFGGSDVERANDIFTLEGVCLKRDASKEDIDALAPGIYIVAGKKMVVK